MTVLNVTLNEKYLKGYIIFGVPKEALLFSVLFCFLSQLSNTICADALREKLESIRTWLFGPHIDGQRTATKCMAYVMKGEREREREKEWVKLC